MSTTVGFAASLCIAFGTPAQSLQLWTANVAPLHNYFDWDDWVPSYWPPAGPVQLPLMAYNGYSPFFIRLELNGSPNSVGVLARGQACSMLLHVPDEYHVSTDLVTTLIMPFPARIQIDAQGVFTPSPPPPPPQCQFEWGIDLGANGIDDFVTTQPQSTTTTLTTWCDLLGSDVRWHHQLFLTGCVAAQSDLTLQFDNPIQEWTYGPTCAGQLGCQLGASTFERVFVASFPANTTLAWLMGGDTQRNVSFPGFACPLLVDPQLVLAVPVFTGPNGRKFIDFEATFPPIPGMVFYTQGIAVSGGTFIGTNGVIVHT